MGNMGLGAGFAAGSGADMLQEILREQFSRVLANKRLQQDNDYRRDSLASLQGARDDAAAAREFAQKQATAKQAEHDAAEATAGNQAHLRAAIQGSQNVAGTNDPNGALATRNALRVALTSSGAKPNEIPEEPEVQKPKLYAVTVAGTNGQPVHKLVTEQQMQQGVPGYQAPRQTTDDTGQYTSVQQVIGPDGKPAMVVVDRRKGTATPIAMPQGFEPNRPARPVTGAERQTLAYYNRMKEAIDALEGGGLEDAIAHQGMLGQVQGQVAPSMLQSESQQRYRQAQRAFTEGRLRKESGAAIPEQEFENDARTYFFQPGDKPETTKQKRAARAKVLEGLKFSSGRAYDEFYGEQSQPKNDAAAKAAELLKKYGGG